MRPYVKGCWLAIMVCNAIANVGAAATPECKLTGIFWLENQKRALLEIHGESASGQRTSRAISLGEGEREGDSGYEVTAIDERSAEVTLRLSGQVLARNLEQAPGEELAKRTFNFQSAELAQVLDIYQQLAGRTVLRPSTLPRMRLDLKSGASLAAADAAELLARALVDKGMLLKPRGDKFIFIVLAGQEKLLSAIAEPPPAVGSGSSEDL